MERLTYWSEEYNCWCYDGPNGEAVNRLTAYENTGLEPEEVTAIKNAVMGQEIAKITEFDGIPIKRLQELAQAEKDGRLVVLPPNDPLTPERLREMDGEPVWISPVKENGKVFARWMLVSGYNHNKDIYLFAPSCNITQGYDGKSYGKTWLAYRRKPEEGAT